MARCEIKVGFLVLRDCENEALDRCSVCGKNVCKKHRRDDPKTNKICCIDCYAKSLDEEAQQNIVSNIPQDGNHCCNCGREVSPKAGKNKPEQKVIHPETMKVYCQECYNELDDDGIVHKTVGASLLNRRMYDDDYWYGYRSHYYHHHHYRPFHSGHSSDFDEKEVRAFNPKNNPQENGQLDDSNNKDNAFDS